MKYAYYKKTRGMDPRLKRRWIAALQSGAYDKCESALCLVDENGARYCCLGVLYELVQGEDAWKGHDYGLRTRSGSRNYYGGHLISEHHMYQLSDVNDDNSSFKQVVKYIKKNL